VLTDLGDRIDVLLDGGSTPVGVESTVLSLVAAVPTILRPGGVSREALERVLGSVALAEETVAEGRRMRSPGTSLRHYAPGARLILFRGERDSVLQAMQQAVAQHAALGHKVGLLVAEEDASSFAGLPAEMRSLGSLSEMDQVAQRLYAALRDLDATHVDVILARDLGTAGLGLAVRDRLTRAAAGRVIEVDASKS
jgi:L-threonylcarbamoyladenylate synthase